MIEAGDSDQKNIGLGRDQHDPNDVREQILYQLKSSLREHITGLKEVPSFIGEDTYFITPDKVLEYMAVNRVPGDSLFRKNDYALSRAGFIPLAFDSDGQVNHIGFCYEPFLEGITDPEDIPSRVYEKVGQLFDVLKLTHLPQRMVLLGREEYRQLVNIYRDPETLREKMNEEHQMVYQETTARKTFTAILRRAVKEGATDIHIQPSTGIAVNESLENVLEAKPGSVDEWGLSHNAADSFRIRYRVDGTLREVFIEKNPKRGRELTALVKADAGMVTHENRAAQDGGIVFRTHNKYLNEPVLKDYSIRISVLPTPLGEKVALRLLQNRPSILELGTLGFSLPMQRSINEVCESPHGIFIVTGPTSSGKTTTLYSILSKLNTPEVNIMTIEDPIEIELPGLTQSQVIPAKGWTFANATRTFMRQDPDIIFVGEMRDKETAISAVEASKTGHLVFSTLHTNNSVGTIPRMRGQLGIEKTDIQTNIKAILAQRLVRKVCKSCIDEYDGRQVLSNLLGEKITDKVPLYVGTGQVRGVKCKTCQGSGYSGRIVVPELWVIRKKEREMIAQGEESEDAFEKVAIAGGMVPLVGAGLELILNGITTPDEILINVTDRESIEEKRDYLLNLIKTHKERVGDYICR